jgi:O-antigen/teichoic acid export membrane protein
MNTNKKTALLHTQAFASQLLPAIIGVLSFMLLVRNTTQEALGQFVIYMATVVLFEMVKSGGLQSALVMRLSGHTHEQEKRIIGSAYWLGGIISTGLSLLLFLLFISKVFTAQPGIQVFCGWYACVGIVTLPLHIAEATAVAKQDIKFLLWLRILQSTSSLCIAIYALFKTGNLEAFATIHLLFNAIVLLVVLVTRKTNPLLIKNKITAEVKELFHLIKYTLATLGTTNLLKSADTFLIGSFLGPKFVAAYAVPIKLTELFEIPLRSLSTTAFPQLAAKNNANDEVGFRGLFTQYISWSYMLYLPALVGAFILAPLVVVLLGGHNYAFTTPVFRVFIFYGLLLPLDRLSGIGLDALQKPKVNFIKVLVMALVNIAGDLLAITLSGKLEWVAFASVLNAATGAIFGLWMLNKAIVLAPKQLLNDALAYTTGFIKWVTAYRLKKVS